MSSWQTPKTNWGQPGQTVPGVDDFNRIEGNIETLGRYDRAPGYGVASGVNTKTVNLDPAPEGYYEGMCFAFRNVTENTGPVTINVNGLGAKSIKKPNGNDLVPGNLKAGSVYTVRYNGTNFILQGSDSAGNATPADVLAGKTFSNDSGPDKVGTMPNNGQVIITPSTQNLMIPAGYHDGTGYVVGSPNLIASNIRNDVNIFGVIGTLREGRRISSTKTQDQGSKSISHSLNPGFTPIMTIGTVRFYYSSPYEAYWTWYTQVRVNTSFFSGVTPFRHIDKLLLAYNRNGGSGINFDYTKDGYGRTGNAFITLEGNLNFTTSESIGSNDFRGIVDATIYTYYIE